jgi:hypothetical protein
MKMIISSLLMLFVSAGQLIAQANSNVRKFSPPSRTLRFTYNFTVKDIPSGAKRVRVWVPVPQTDQHQTVRILAIKAPAKKRMTQDPEYGNRTMYAELQNPATTRQSSPWSTRSRAANTRAAIMHNLSVRTNGPPSCWRR